MQNGMALTKLKHCPSGVHFEVPSCKQLLIKELSTSKVGNEKIGYREKHAVCLLQTGAVTYCDRVLGCCDCRVCFHTNPYVIFCLLALVEGIN